MRMPKLIFASVCLVGLTQLAWSQSHAIGARRHGTPGFLGQSGRFAPRAEHSGAGNPADAPLAGTPILFRETFVFTISAGDIPAAAVIICYADIETEDTNGEYYEENGVVATRSGSTATCTVPILAKWTLVNPTTDTIDARYDVYSEQGVSIGGGDWEDIYRGSEGPDLSLPVPANTQTVTTDISITM
jgi:hypothetical protein